jgi:hypothetical protein
MNKPKPPAWLPHDGKEAEPLTTITLRGTKQVGRVQILDGTLVLVKQVEYAKHHHHNFGAWGIQASVLYDLQQHGVEKVRLEVDNGQVLEAFVHKYSLLGRVRDCGPDGRQVFLADHHWVKVEGGAQLNLL